MNTFNKHFEKTTKIEHLVHYMMLEVIPEITSPNTSDIELRKIKQEHAEQYFNSWLTVGQKWNWVGRIIAGETALKTDLEKGIKQIFNIALKEEIIGVCEYQITNGTCEIIYFGLIEKYFGKGWADIAFQTLLQHIILAQPKRVWLHTCSLDAPQAKPLYRKHGFRTYKIQKELVQLYTEVKI